MSFEGVYTLLFILTILSHSFIFCNPGPGYKNVHVSFYTSRYPSLSLPLNMLHCWLSASPYLHASTYTWGSIFNNAVALQYMLTMKICLNAYFPYFQLTMQSFYRFLSHFFKWLWFKVILNVFILKQFKLILNVFILKHPFWCFRKIKWHCAGRVLVILRYAIAEYVFGSLEKTVV